MKKYSRLNNIEIKAAPNAKYENLIEVLCRVRTRVKRQVQPSDIDKIHRIPTPKNRKANNTVAGFFSCNKKNEFQMKAREARLTAKELALCCESMNIYFNDYWSPQNKAIFLRP